MTSAVAVTLAVLGLVLVALMRERADPGLVLASAVGALLVLGVATPAGALSGLASPAVAVVAILLVLAGSLERSPLLPWLATRVLGTGARVPWMRALLPVAAVSSVVPNTAVVAVLIPSLRRWADERDLPLSKVLLPFSFACILGGGCTLLGTSTNLVVHGLLLESTGEGLAMFDVAVAAVPMALAGLAVLMLVAPRLPERHDPLEELDADPRRYLARVRVSPGSPVVGRQVETLRHLSRVFLAGLERGGRRRSPVDPDVVIQADDVLVFVGLVDRVAELLQTPGLVVDEAAGGVEIAGEEGQLVEAVVSSSAPIVGQNIRDAAFRGRYDAVVLGVHRHGEQVQAKIGDIVVRPGDTLLLMAGRDFLPRWRAARDFYLVSRAGRMPRSMAMADWVEPTVLLAVVATATLGWLELLQAGVVGLGALLVTGRVRAMELWQRLPWSTLMTIAMAISLGQVLKESGTVAWAAAYLHAVSDAGPVAAIAAIMVVTGLLTEVVTNTASAAIVLPVALSLGATVGLEPGLVAVAVAVAASASFLSAVGYQTNTMVAGAAGYTAVDFLRFGLPMKVVTLAAGIASLAWVASRAIG